MHLRGYKHRLQGGSALRTQHLAGAFPNDRNIDLQRRRRISQ